MQFKYPLYWTIDSLSCLWTEQRKRTVSWDCPRAHWRDKHGKKSCWIFFASLWDLLQFFRFPTKTNDFDISTEISVCTIQSALRHVCPSCLFQRNAFLQASSCSALLTIGDKKNEYEMNSFVHTSFAKRFLLWANLFQLASQPDFSSGTSLTFALVFGSVCLCKM